MTHAFPRPASAVDKHSTGCGPGTLAAAASRYAEPSWAVRTARTEKRKRKRKPLPPRFGSAVRTRRSCARLALRPPSQRAAIVALLCAADRQQAAAQRAVAAMNFFKRARTPDELVLKCCNSYEELAKAPATGAARQGVRSDTALSGPFLRSALTAGVGHRHVTTSLSTWAI